MARISDITVKSNWHTVSCRSERRLILQLSLKPLQAAVSKNYGLFRQSEHFGL